MFAGAARCEASLPSSLWWIRFPSPALEFVLIVYQVPYKDKEKRREHGRKWVARRRAEWLVDKCCVRCGSKEELEVDHIEPGAKFEHRVWSWAKPRMLAELAKCQVLCRTCHDEKTRTDGSLKISTHGGPGMYENHGCRCDECRAWKRRVNAQRKARGWA